MNMHAAGAHEEGLIRLYFKYLVQQNAQACLHLMSENASQYFPFAPPGFAKAIEGKKRLLEHYRRLMGEHKWLRFPVHAIHATGWPVVFWVEYSIIARRSSGKTYTNRFMTKFTFEEDRIREITEYYNPIVFLEALNEEPGLRIRFSLN